MVSVARFNHILSIVFPKTLTMADQLHPILLKRIQKHFTDQGAQQVSVETTKTNNSLSVISKVVVKSDTGTSSYILKSAPNVEDVRKSSQIDRLFKKEIFAYEKLFALYNELLQENGVLKNFATIPKLIYTCNETYQESLIIQDLTQLGFQQTNFQSLDEAHLTLVMKTYGKLHALSFAMREQRPEHYKKIAEYTRERFNTNVNVESINNKLKSACQEAFETLNPSKDRRAMLLFKKFMDKPFDYQLQALKMGAMGSYSVINHGEALLNNILFKYNDPDRPTIPTDISTLDWQFCRFGSPAFDISQFLFLFTDKKFRDKYYQQMIRAYYYSLCAYMTELNLNADEILPYDMLNLQLKRFSIYGLSTAILTLRSLLGQSEDGAVCNGMSNGGATCQDGYKVRMRDVINDFVEYGYLEFIN